MKLSGWTRCCWDIALLAKQPCALSLTVIYGECAELFDTRWNCDENEMLKCYKRFTVLFEQVVPRCRLDPLRGLLFRRFWDKIKKAIVECGAEVLNHIDPPNNRETHK